MSAGHKAVSFIKRAKNLGLVPLEDLQRKFLVLENAQNPRSRLLEALDRKIRHVEFDQMSYGWLRKDAKGPQTGKKAPRLGFKFSFKEAPEDAVPPTDEIFTTAGFTTGDLRMWEFEQAVKEDPTLKFSEFFKGAEPQFGVRTLDGTKTALFEKTDDFLGLIHKEMGRNADVYLFEALESFNAELQNRTIDLMEDPLSVVVSTVPRKSPNEPFTFTNHLQQMRWQRTFEIESAQQSRQIEESILAKMAVMDVKTQSWLDKVGYHKVEAQVHDLGHAGEDFKIY